MEFYKCFQDIRQFISDQRLDNPHFYKDDYIETVAIAYCELLTDKGWKGYYDDVPHVSDDEFWECFKCAENGGNE